MVPEISRADENPGSMKDEYEAVWRARYEKGRIRIRKAEKKKMWTFEMKPIRAGVSKFKPSTEK